MHRRAAATPSSSKVAASRERRALRNGGGGSIRSDNGGGGGLLPHHLSAAGGKKRGESSTNVGKILLYIIVGALLLCLMFIWGGAVYHFTTSSDDSSNGGGTMHVGKFGRISLPKNGLRRMRNDETKHVSEDGGIIISESFDGQNPYTSAALKKNPYLGWQPPVVPPPDSWRTCFKAPPTSDGTDQPAGCKENPSEWGDAPIVEDKNWVPDVTMIRKMMLYGKDRDGNPFPPPLATELCEDISVTGEKHNDENKRSLKQTMIHPTGQLNSTTVTINPQNHYGQDLVEADGAVGSITVPAPKVMCLVYTMANAHANRIRAMRETWAGGCDGFLAFSTESDPRLPAISLEHEGPEEYGNMWQKIRSMWKFVGTHYLDDYDWFFIGGDDLFVLPHNLKTYLSSLTHKDGTDPKTKEYFVGRRFNSGGHDYFNSGGAGYTLSQATLRKFHANLDDATHCSAGTRTSMEDVMIARCLNYLGIHFTDTRDAHGRERFHPFAPGTHLDWKPPKEGEPPDWYDQYNKEWGLKTGVDCCAPDSVSFHYIKKASMVRHVQALIYNCDAASR